LELEGDALRGQITAAVPGDTKRNAAIEKYKAAIALIESVRDRVGAEAFSERQDSFRPYQSLVPLLIQAWRADEAFDYLQRARSKKLRDSLRLDAIRTQEPGLQNLLRRAGILEGQLRSVQRAIESEQARPEAERDARKIGDLQRVAASTQSEFLRLTRELRAKNPSYDKVIAVKPTALKEAQADIPSDVALVQYAPLGEQLYIFVVTRESLKIFAPPVKPTELSTRIREFRRLMDNAREKFENGESIGIEDWATQKDSAPLRDNLTTLYSMLLAPHRGRNNR
jgi:hypothetical protein